MMREPLPNRRAIWTQEVRLGGQKLFLSVGEYDDGRPGEVWLVAAKQGEFLRGILDSLSRVVSIALQCGTPVEDVVAALAGVNYPPNGDVVGERTPVKSACSVPDWVAQELAAVYLGAVGAAAVTSTTEYA